MSGPVRIQLSRAKGFRLQEASLAINGLPAVKVDRTTKWGNPWSVQDGLTAAEAVEKFRCREVDLLAMAPSRHAHEMEHLRGKNLACWCKPDAPCHASVLLELANRPTDDRRAG